MKTHKHHIIPKHMGGSDDPTNIVELTIEEHAEAHRKLYEEYGHWQDKVAWQGLAKLITKAELIYTVLSESMKGENNPMYGKPAPNRGKKRPGVGGRKKGTKWSAAERETHQQIRAKEGFYDFTQDPERNKKISAAHKGKIGAAAGKSWFNNGETETYAFECPDGFVKGRKPRKQIGKRGMKWYNNGVVSKQFRDGKVPEGFVRGRIIKK